METRTFTILGESLSGKTTYLLAMYSELSQTLDGYSILAQDKTLNSELLILYEKLDDESSSEERFPDATDQNQIYNFYLNYSNKPIRAFDWIDYPGGLLRNANYDGYGEVSKTINKSSTLFICVDGEHLVGNDTERKIKRVKKKCGMTINAFLGRYFRAGGKLPPVGIILTKSDLFMHDTDDAEVRKILAEAFSPLFVSRETLIGVIPVTLGKNIQDDNYRGELEPVNVHLPIFMAIWCALNDSIKEYDGKLAANKNSTFDLYDRISSANRRIESLESSIKYKKGERDKEKDKWFFSRSDRKISTLQGEINQAESERKSKQNDIDDYYRRISNNNAENSRIQGLRSDLN